MVSGDPLLIDSGSPPYKSFSWAELLAMADSASAASNIEHDEVFPLLMSQPTSHLHTIASKGRICFFLFM